MKNLMSAKVAIMLAKKQHTAPELVLAEILDLCLKENGVPMKTLSETIPDKLTITNVLFRKAIGELKKLNLITKEGTYVYINPKYFNNGK